MASVKERVIDIVAEQLGRQQGADHARDVVRQRPGRRFARHVELVMELEEEFDINIPDDAAEKIQTVGQAVEYIEKTQS